MTEGSAFLMGISTGASIALILGILGGWTAGLQLTLLVIAVIAGALSLGIERATPKEIEQ